jgi:class 3 adenylate cyclase
MDYVSLEGIENRTGVGKENLYGFTLKEVMDNGLDSHETQSSRGQLKDAQVEVTITKEDSALGIAIRNSNDSGKAPFSKEKLESIFNSNIFYSSKRNQYKITRGALGDAFKEILCIPYALARKYNNNTVEWKQPLVITTKVDNTLQTFLVSLRINRINQTIHTEIQESNKSNTKEDNETQSNFTEIKIHLPLIEEILDLYGTFLNSVATIARNFGAKILKNAGDCLIYYFSNTSGSSKNGPVFKNVLECGITLISAHRIINSKLLKHNLPPLNYRISADYGKVEFAKSVSSQADDLFGPAVNLCAKINSKAPRNGMVIGNNLYEIVKSIDDFSFEQVKDVYTEYDVYTVKDKRKRIILNPFKQYSQNEPQ